MYLALACVKYPSSGCGPSFHNTNVEISERQENDQPDSTDSSGDTDILIHEACDIYVGNNVVGSITWSALRHRIDDGELVEAPDKLQCGYYDNNTTQAGHDYVPEASPHPSTIYRCGIKQILLERLQTSQEHQGKKRKFAPDTGKNDGYNCQAACASKPAERSWERSPSEESN